MSTDTMKAYVTIKGTQLGAKSLEQARMSAKSMGTLLLCDGTKLQQDIYKARSLNQTG